MENSKGKIEGKKEKGTVKDEVDRQCHLSHEHEFGQTSEIRGWLVILWSMGL